MHVCARVCVPVSLCVSVCVCVHDKYIKLLCARVCVCANVRACASVRAFMRSFVRASVLV